MKKFFLFVAIIVILQITVNFGATWIIPPNVLKIINVSLNNNQGSTLLAGTQVLVTFNGIAYNTIFNGNIINLEVFNGLTGNVLYTFFAGDPDSGGDASAINTGQIAGFNTVSNDQLYVVLPANILANTNAINVITIGLLPMSSTALNGNNMGIAPQIYCNSGCPQTYYAQFDDGIFVFNSLYTNFKGSDVCSTVLQNLFQCDNGSGGFGTGNFLRFTGSASITSLNQFNPENLTLEADGFINFPDHYQQFGWYNTSSGIEYAIMGCSGGTCSSATGNYNIGQVSSTPKDLLFATAAAISSVGVRHILSVWTTPSNVLGGINYNITSANAGFVRHPRGQVRLTFAAVSQTNAWFQYLYLRQTPANGIMPIVTFGAIQSTSTKILPTLTLSNTLIDQGQSILFTAVQSGGTQPYSYAYNVYATNSGSITLIANQLYTGNSITSNTWTWTPNPNLYTGNTLFFANVVVVDSAGSPVTVNSIANSFGYNSALTVSGNTLSNTLLDSGQYFTISATASGGTTSYTYTFYNTTSTQSAISNCNGISTNICTLKSSSVSQGNAFKYNVLVTDSATTVVSVNTISNSLTVNVLPTFTITPSNIILDSSQFISYKIQATPGTGTAPFTVNLVNLTSVSNTQVQSNVIILTIGGSNNIKFKTTSPTQANVFSYCAIITDYGLTTNSVYASSSNSITVNTIPSLTLTTPTNPVLTGTQVIYTVTESGGTGLTDTQFYNATALSGISNDIVLIGGTNTFSLQATCVPSSCSYIYNAIGTDKGTTTPFLFNSLSNTLSIENSGAGGTGGPSGGGGGGGAPIISLFTNTTNSISQISKKLSNFTLPAATELQKFINNLDRLVFFYPLIYTTQISGYGIPNAIVYSYIIIFIGLLGAYSYARYLKKEDLKTYLTSFIIITIIAVGYGYVFLPS